MISWIKDRDPFTTQLIHTMYDGSKKVAVVKSVRHPYGKFEVRIKDQWPWHRKTLTSAKKDCEFVYVNCK